MATRSQSAKRNRTLRLIAATKTITTLQKRKNINPRTLTVKGSDQRKNLAKKIRVIRKTKKGRESLRRGVSKEKAKFTTKRLMSKAFL